jgi:hypothetical protein
MFPLDFVASQSSKDLRSAAKNGFKLKVSRMLSQGGLLINEADEVCV